MRIARDLAYLVAGVAIGAAAVWVAIGMDRSYGDCLLSHLSSGQTKNAVDLIDYACGRRWPNG